MKRTILSLIAIIALATMAGCIQKRDHYRIYGQIEGDRPISGKVYLYEYMPEYGKSRLVDSSFVVERQFLMHGYYADRAEAYVTFDRDTSDYYFILSPDNLNIKIGTNSYSVTGTDANAMYSALIRRQHAMVNRRGALREDYHIRIVDSTLTVGQEDSLLRIYRTLPIDFQRDIAATITENLKKDPILADLTFRTFSVFLPPKQADSLRIELK